MQKIPVTRDGKKGSEIYLLDSNEVIKIEFLSDRRFIFHTSTTHYYLDLSLESIEEWLFEDGFRLLDSTNIVNMNHVSDYDSKKGVVYLGDVVDNAQKMASAARIHKEHISNVMEILNLAKLAQADYNQLPALNPISEMIVTNENERFSRSYATLHAVNQRKLAEARIYHLAYHDTLTNLPNRLFFQDKLTQALASANNNDSIIAVLFLGVDRFKYFNDSLGHQVGDLLLRYIAEKLLACVPADGILSRFNGDEFLIFLPNITHLDEVSAFARNVPLCLKEPFLNENQEYFVTMTIGISISPTDSVDSNSLIQQADLAMHWAKENGRNTFQLFHPEMNKQSAHRLKMEAHLRKALEKNELLLYYQPLVDLKNNQVFGMEALIRWKHPEWGLVSPAEFIPLAEETGLILPIGLWVLKEACRQNLIWNKKGDQSLSVSVNISALQFHQLDFVHMVRIVLEETGLPPALLCLEITENVAMKNVTFLVETMSKLRNLGVSISIDDFGTGYSSLAYLKRFRVHTLKIDQSFVRDVTTDSDSAAIVTALIAMSKKLKIKSLAEGVETQEQLDFLRKNGCDEIQGYLFSPPLPADKFEKMWVYSQR